MYERDMRAAEVVVGEGQAVVGDMGRRSRFLLFSHFLLCRITFALKSLRLAARCLDSSRIDAFGPELMAIMSVRQGFLGAGLQSISIFTAATSKVQTNGSWCP